MVDKVMTHLEGKGDTQTIATLSCVLDPRAGSDPNNARLVKTNMKEFKQPHSATNATISPNVTRNQKGNCGSLLVPSQQCVYDRCV